MSERIASVDRIVEDALRLGAPGALVAVLRGGEVVHRAAYGLANLETQTPMTPESGFRICSVSKQFTCLLVRMLEAEGRLELDASPRRYLPALPDSLERVTLRNLCQNASGLRDYWCLAMLTGPRPESRFRREDAERILFADTGFQFEPGTAFSYNNGNFTLLGWVIEAVCGAPYAEVLAERILDPLGMSATGVPADTASPLAGDTLGYEPASDDGVMHAEVDINWEADAGIVSTLDDLIRWEQNFDTNRLGAPDLLESLYATPTFPGGARGDYAYGLRVARHRGFPTQGHSGGLRGWRMRRMRFPTEGLSVIACFNHLTNADEVAERIADSFLPGRRVEPREPGEVSGAVKYAGFFIDPDSGRGFEVGVREGALHLGPPGAAAALFADGRHSFNTASGDVRVTFDATNPQRITIRHWSSNYCATLHRVAAVPRSRNLSDYAGRFENTALGASITLDAGGGRMSVSVEGPLGRVDDWPVRVAGDDVLVMDVDRALDYRPPGAFVLWLRRGPGRRVESLTVSCDLAYGCRFEPVHGD